MTGKAPRKKKILIVEDVESMRALLEYAVKEMSGYEVSEAVSNGFECRASLAKKRPDLVLLDEVLPGESSLDLLKEIETLGLPVVLMTGMETDRCHPIPPGAFDRVFKPSWDTLKQAQNRIKRAMDRALA